MRFLIFLFTISTQFSSNLYAVIPIINLDNHLRTGNLGKSVVYFEDQSAKLTLKQVLSLSENGQFKPGKTDILNFGNTKSAFWIKITCCLHPLFTEIPPS